MYGRLMSVFRLMMDDGQWPMREMRDASQEIKAIDEGRALSSFSSQFARDGSAISRAPFASFVTPEKYDGDRFLCYCDRINYSCRRASPA